MSDYIERLYADRQRAFESMRAIYDQAHSERRDSLTGEEEAAYARGEAEVRDLDARIREWRAQDERTRAADEARASIEHVVRSPVESRPGMNTIERFLRGETAEKALDVSFRGLHVTSGADGRSRVEQRDVLAGTGSGSLTVPTIVPARLYEILLDQGAIWQLQPDIVQTSDGADRDWPKLSAAGTGSIVAEAGTLTEDDPTLAKVTTSPFKYGALTQISNELATDSAVDIIGLVGRHGGYALANLYGPHFATGTGSGQPEGYMVGGSVTKQASGTCSPESAIDLAHSINQQYRRGAKYSTNSGVLGYWRKLRADAGGTTGPWLLAPPSAPGAFETFLGHEVVEDSNITAHGSGVKSVAFGNFNAGYLVHQGGPFRFERSDDYAFNQDLISFRHIWRLDGKVRDNRAIAIYQATAN